MSSIYEILCTLLNENKYMPPRHMIELKILQIQDMINFETVNIQKTEKYIKTYYVNQQLLKLKLNLDRYIIKLNKLKQYLDENIQEQTYKSTIKCKKILSDQTNTKSILDLQKQEILRQILLHKSPDVFKILKHISSKYNGFAQSEIILEENCAHGDKCPNINNPLICPFNHFNLGKLIKLNDPIPIQLCKYERPWIIINGLPSHCTNIKCYFSHLHKRKKYIDFIKEIIENSTVKFDLHNM